MARSPDLRSSFHSQQLHIKNQSGVRRDYSASALRSIPEIWRDAQLTLAADFHSGDAFVPAFNNLASAERELERMSRAHGAVELLAVGEPSGVVHFNFLSGGGG